MIKGKHDLKKSPFNLLRAENKKKYTGSSEWAYRFFPFPKTHFVGQQNEK